MDADYGVQVIVDSARDELGVSAWVNWDRILDMDMDMEIVVMDEGSGWV